MKQPTDTKSILPTFEAVAKTCDQLADEIFLVRQEFMELQKKSVYFAEEIHRGKTDIPGALLELHLIGKKSEILNEKIRTICRKNLDLNAKIEEWGV